MASADLRQLNLDIANAENDGAKPFFEPLLASAFAFRRANGAVVDRQGFLEALKAGGDRSTEPDSIRIMPLGNSRALVTCVVSMGPPDQRKRFDNARLFARDEKQQWRLLAWANEAI